MAFSLFLLYRAVKSRDFMNTEINRLLVNIISLHIVTTLSSRIHPDVRAVAGDYRSIMAGMSIQSVLVYFCI